MDNETESPPSGKNRKFTPTLDCDEAHVDVTVGMVSKESQRAEEQKPQQQTMDIDPRSEEQIIGVVGFRIPNLYVYIQPDDYKMIAGIPWFSRQAVLADAEDDFV